MVSKKQLLARINDLENENKNLSSLYDRILKSLSAINKKINAHIKDEKGNEEEKDRISEWLNDSRVDEIQEFINKGVK